MTIDSIQLIENINFFSGGGSLAATGDIFDLAQMASPFFSTVVLLGFVTMVLHLVGYYSLMMVADIFHKGGQQPPLFIVLKDALVLVLKRGFIAVLLYWLIVLGAQVVLPPAIFFVAPGIMIPVLLVTERCSLFRSIGRVVKLNFAHSFPGGKWALFFQFLSLGAFVYTGVLLMFYFRTSIYDIDIFLGITNTLFTREIDGLPFNALYAFVLTFQLLLWSLLLVFTSTYSVSAYHWVRAFDKKLPSGGVRV